MADQDQAFFEFAAQRGIISALEAETLRTELQRKRTTQKDMTAQILLVRKGFVTDSDADALYLSFELAVGGDTLMPSLAENNTPRPSEPKVRLAQKTADAKYSLGPGATGFSPVPETSQHTALEETGQSKRPTNKRPSKKLTSSRTATGPIINAQGSSKKITAKREKYKSTTNRVTNRVKKDIDWGGIPTDSLSATDKIVPAGTIISGGTMSIAEVRQQAGLDDGVKLISNKMDSMVAHLQPDAAAEQRRYVVIREIARGGMGKVLEVEDTELRRSVALKVLRKELVGRADIVERFLEEAQITGQLEHPNIVPVHEMGIDGAGNLYFTMKYVEGLSLAELLLKLREGNRDLLRDYPLTKLLDIFIRICESISFAHNRGVIHRDLKPANIMVGKFGEVQVMDWGVAKVIGREVGRSTDKLVLTDRLDANSAHTMAGAIIGTPSYMSPEQAKGDIDSMGAATDIFSLGVILYEMLSQRSPWTGKTSDEVLDQVRELVPDKPSVRNPDVSIPEELAKLAMRCLEKAPENRLTSVKELGQNIRNYIEGRTMGAVDYSIAKVFSKWVSRHRGFVMAAIGGVVLVIGAILGTNYYLQSDKQAVVDSMLANATDMENSARDALSDADYDSAVLYADQAHGQWNKIIEISPSNEDAESGLDSVDSLRVEIRSAELSSLTIARHKAQVEQLVQESVRILGGVKDSDGYFSAKGSLMGAWEKISAALEADPDNKQAKELQTRISYVFAEKSLVARQFPVCQFWLDEMKATERMPREYKALYKQWQTLRD